MQRIFQLPIEHAVIIRFSLGLPWLFDCRTTNQNQNTKLTYNQLSVDCGFKQTILFATTVLHNHYQFTNTRSVESHQDTIEVTKTLSSH